MVSCKGLECGIHGVGYTTEPLSVIQDCVPSLKMSVIPRALPEYSWEIRTPVLRDPIPDPFVFLRSVSLQDPAARPQHCADHDKSHR